MTCKVLLFSGHHSQNFYVHGLFLVKISQKSVINIPTHFLKNVNKQVWLHDPARSVFVSYQWDLQARCYCCITSQTDGTSQKERSQNMLHEFKFCWHFMWMGLPSWISCLTRTNTRQPKNSVTCHGFPCQCHGSRQPGELHAFSENEAHWEGRRDKCSLSGRGTSAIPLHKFINWLFTAQIYLLFSSGSLPWPLHRRQVPRVTPTFGKWQLCHSRPRTRDSDRRRPTGKTHSQHICSQI